MFLRSEFSVFPHVHAQRYTHVLPVYIFVTVNLTYVCFYGFVHQNAGNTFILKRNMCYMPWWSGPWSTDEQTLEQLSPHRNVNVGLHSTKYREAKLKFPLLNAVSRISLYEKTMISTKLTSSFKYSIFFRPLNIMSYVCCSLSDAGQSERIRDVHGRL